jgi:arsenate reductase (glutaredoxin)
MKMTILSYPICSTCRKAIQWLKDNNIEFVERNISMGCPIKGELNFWYQKSV